MDSLNQEKLLYKKQSRYNDITVIQNGPIVTLYSPSNVIQSEINLKQPLNPHLEFNRSLMFSLAFCPKPATVLALGLGGGVVPGVLSALFPAAQVDVVEIDPEMLKVAENYFGFTRSSALRVHIEDACAFIGRADREYDMILLDTYCGIELAETVDNRSFFENCAALLSGAGILAVNLIPRRAGHMEERLSWFRHALGHVYLMRGITRTNEVAYARKNPIDKITLAKNLISIKKKLPANLKAKQMLKRLEDRSH